MYDVTHGSQPVPYCCLQGSQGSNLCCKWKLPQPTKRTVKDHRYQKCQVTCCQSQSFKTNILEKYYFCCAVHNQPPPPIASTTKGQFFPLVVVIITASYLLLPESSLKKLLMTISTAGTKELRRLKPAFPPHTKLTVSWASLALHTYISWLLKTASCFLSSSTRSSSS